MCCERDVTTEDRNLNVLRDPDFGPLDDGNASSPVPNSERTVRVLVSGRPVALPERALRAGLLDLRLATEARAGLEDYAVGVGLVLSASESAGMIAIHS